MCSIKFVSSSLFTKDDDEFNDLSLSIFLSRGLNKRLAGEAGNCCIRRLGLGRNDGNENLCCNGDVGLTLAPLINEFSDGDERKSSSPTCGGSRGR